MPDITNHTEWQSNLAESDMDVLRQFAFGERGVAPKSYPAFDLSFLTESARERISVTEKVTIWLDKLGNVVVEWLDALAAPPKPSLVTRATKQPDMSARRVIVKSDYTHQPSIELVVRDGEPRSLVVRVGEWPLFIPGVRVLASAGAWQGEAATDDEGEATFTLPPDVAVEAVRVELVLAKN